MVVVYKFAWISQCARASPLLQGFTPFSFVSDACDLAASIPASCDRSVSHVRGTSRCGTPDQFFVRSATSFASGSSVKSIFFWFTSQFEVNKPTSSRFSSLVPDLYTEYAE